MMIGNNSVQVKLKEEWKILKEVLLQPFDEKITISNDLKVIEYVASEKLKNQQLKIDLLLELLTETT